MFIKRVSFVVSLVLAAGSAVSYTATASAVPKTAAVATTQVSPSWVNSATVYEVNVRQFSPAGNFAGVTAALPRIKALGTSVVWLMPIYPVGKLNAKGSLGSPYSVANYTAVNPDFGTDADFKNLVDTAHSLGMKVVLDWVANHSAWDNPWITQHKDWYTQDGSGNIIWPAGTDWTDVADLNYDNTGLRAGMIDAMKYWVSTFDIDGYRCDAAGMVPTDFWNDATAQVNQLKQLWWLAEDQANTDLLSKAFSANYNWNLLHALNNIANRGDLAYSIITSATDYPANTYPMNFITNHDENSWSGTEFQRLGAAVKEGAAITFMTPGIPLIYDGQEVGMNHQLAFFEKDPIDWAANPDAASWTKFYNGLTTLRKKNAALWSGAAGGRVDFLTSNSRQVLSFGRYAGKNKVLLLANLGSTNVKVKVNVDANLAGTYYPYLGGKAVKLKKGKAISVKLAASGFVIYSTTK